jgi:hypothetical protein
MVARDHATGQTMLKMLKRIGNALAGSGFIVDPVWHSTLALRILNR